MRRFVFVLLSLFLVCTLVQAQVAPPLFPPALDDLNTSHPLARGLLAWWIVLPPTQAGPTWWNYLKRYHGLLVNMGSGSGWQPTWRPEWYGEMRFDGSDDRVDLGDLSVWDFTNMTFTVHLRFRSTVTTGNAMLITRRDATGGGGWFLRHGSTGGLTARIYAGDSATVAAQWVSTTTGLNNGDWQSATILFTTNTTTPSSNVITGAVNGVFEGTASNPNADVYNICGAGCAVQLGGFGTGGSLLTGAMDDIRIWTRALTAAEVLALHRDTPPTFGGLLESPEVLVGQAAPATKRRVVIE